MDDYDRNLVSFLAKNIGKTNFTMMTLIYIQLVIISKDGHLRIYENRTKLHIESYDIINFKD